jgi:hypothetical protein
MDFVWVTSDDANAIQNSIVNAKGDLIGASANDTPAITSVGSNFAFLQADSAQSTGLLWNNAAWTSYTPTLTPQTGTITTSSASGYYLRIGKLCAVYVRANITTAGTGGGGLGISLPFTSANTNEQIFVGRETIATGVALTGNIQPNSTEMSVITAAVGGVINDGRRAVLSGTYEVA